MTNLIVELSKYGLTILVALYTLMSFSILKQKTAGQEKGFGLQRVILFFLHFLAYAVMYFQTENDKLLVFYVAQVLLVSLVQMLFQTVYPGTNRLVLNNMCFLLSVGFIVLTRLSYDRAVKQFQIALLSLLVCFFVPFLIRKLKFLPWLSWVYGGAGLVLLVVVMLVGKDSNGAKLSLRLGESFAVQPSEFVKILFALFTASRLSKSTAFRDVVVTSVVAGIHVVILVLSRDLGGALIFFVMYLIVLYAASKQPLYLFGGLAAGCGASYVAYQLFAHVRVRVLAWSDPFSYIDKEGYQITQSLFAIGTGGWFGMGLFQGTPNKIPYVEQDFVFSAVAEELGGIFAICLILICLSSFLMFVNIAMQLREPFYRLAALGLGTLYGFQVFLTIGGGIKCIPSTGVTLPLVSYGGSSLLASLLSFSIIQGMYLLREDEETKIEKEKRVPKKGKTQKTKKES
ncbi:MAG: FtsW/RodA/SpoVE family cell cycle protein [Lachnospiraceae bacterium]|nr:FtsW/RodA/SpoVE family cell cycle protein [Lachnospiraceae bacterium]